MHKLHQNFERQAAAQEDKVKSLESEVTSVKNQLVLCQSKARKSVHQKTSSFRSFKQIATAPCHSKMLKNNKRKLVELLPGIPQFKSDDLEEMSDSIIGQGQFGKLTLVKLKRLNTVVVSKNLSSETSSKNDIYAEIVSGMSLAGEKYFPFVFGLLNECSILMEFFGEASLSGHFVSPTLWAYVKDKRPSFSELKRMFIECLNAVLHMHSKKILHNDIKADNFIVAKDCMKLIDFGKAAVMSFPKVYHIKPGSEQSKQYNIHHRHLAYELRNIPGSKQSILTDTFSIGYMFKHTAAIVKCAEIVQLGQHMKVVEAEFRTPLLKAKNVLENFKF